ncbi:MAG TPA: hypothetical protein VGH28_03090 [Polyangiaceae bacterium]|jgi:hypothetical protein
MRSFNMVPVRPMILVAVATALSGCRAIGGIFKAGVWVGVVVAVFAVLIVGAVLSLTRRATP